MRQPNEMAYRMNRALTLIELLVTIAIIAILAAVLLPAVSFIPIYWNGKSGLDNLACFYDPPAGYEYKWFGK